MARAPYVRNEAKYTAYYMNQAGGGGELPGYIGSRVQYGGVAGIFRALYRMAVPLILKGVGIAKPHLKTAAKNIAGDVVSKITRAAFNKQDGSGLVVVTKRPKKRPPSFSTAHARPSKKRKTKKTRAKKTKSVKKQSFGRRRPAKSRRIAKDIFK